MVARVAETVRPPSPTPGERQLRPAQCSHFLSSETTEVPGGPASPRKLVKNADSQVPLRTLDSVDGEGGPPGAHVRSDLGPLLGPTVPLPSEAPLPCGGLLSGGQGSSSDLSGPPDLSPGFQFPLTLRMRLRPLKPSSLHQPLISILLLGSTRSKLS